MHTDSTLELLTQATRTLGNGLREFQEKTCAAFTTYELERERAARMRRQGKKLASSPNSEPTQSSIGKKPKEFRLKSYKLHVLGDYCNTIRCFGTTDSYSTQPVRLFDIASMLLSNINYLSE